MGAPGESEATRQLIKASRALKAQMRMMRIDIRRLLEEQEELLARSIRLSGFTEMLSRPRQDEDRDQRLKFRDL